MSGLGPERRPRDEGAVVDNPDGLVYLWRPGKFLVVGRVSSNPQGGPLPQLDDHVGVFASSELAWRGDGM